MDNATFLATLTPDLREEVLLYQGNVFLESLPPEIQQEAQILRQRHNRSSLIDAFDYDPPSYNRPSR
jgi:hypothetical protein